MSKHIDIRNPFVWLHRLRHRRGYGVHSPFAFALITQVVYSPGRYYAYDRLNRLHSRADRLLRPRRRAVCRLLFRLANFVQPARICAPGAPQTARAYLQAGCRKAVVSDRIEPDSLLIYIYRAWESKELPRVADGGVVVVDGLRRHRRLWRQLKDSGLYRVTLDLHDVGLAFRRDSMQRDDYVVNW